MTTYFAKKIFLEEGWAENVHISINKGSIAKLSIEKQKTPSIEDELDIVIPGITNSHSHSFQRALSGFTERGSNRSNDTFWTWREKMYQLVDNLDTRSIYTIAKQAYFEMMMRGYTTVVEFHYFHRDNQNNHINNDIFHALLEAANESGINLVYTPILYQRGGFKDKELTKEQKKFYSTIKEFLEHYSYAKSILMDPHSIAIGAHSLRAVGEDALREIVKLHKIEQIPFHIHIAEQQQEVDEFKCTHGERPVEWLLNNYDVNENWCLVHATHINENELKKLAQTKSVVCLCPTTEANLGDGIFQLKNYDSHGGYFTIGSDSNISIDPFEELRWLEYSQRLIHQKRNIVSEESMGTGQYLFKKILTGGALSSGQRSNGHIKEGAPANLIVLSDENASLAGHKNETLFDAIVFSNHSELIHKVMINGEWVKFLSQENKEIKKHKKSYSTLLGRILN